MKEVKVGQKIFVKGIGNRCKYGISEYEVNKVGRKYFYASRSGYSHDTKFCKDTWREHITNYSSTYQAYESMEAYQKESNERFVRDTVWREMNCGFRLPSYLTFDDINKIYMIMLEAKEKSKK